MLLVCVLHGNKFKKIHIHAERFVVFFYVLLLAVSTSRKLNSEVSLSNIKIKVVIYYSKYLIIPFILK